MKLRPGAPEEVGMVPDRVRRLAGLAKDWVAQGITSALVVLVARRGVIVLHEAFGRLTPDADSPALQRDAIYPLLSLTKPITATAAMLLVEDGRLGLNRPVSEYLPEFAGEGKDAVMVHHLLTHTSGLVDADARAYAVKQGLIRAAEPNRPQVVPIDQVLLAAYGVPLSRSPGEEMSYSSLSYELLGEIVRRVSGRSLADFAAERIFTPLGMQDTCYIVPESLGHRIVRRPASAPGGTTIDSREFQQRPGAANGVYAAALDMATFAQMFLNRGRYGHVRLLSPAAVAEMTRDQVPGISGRWGQEVFPEASWGFGWDIHGSKKRTLRDASLFSPQAFSHGGAGGVYLWVDPVYEIVGVYFSVWLELLPNGFAKGSRDLFVNASTAAATDD
jgi:CubicO group peptidase (beta-lactamase class C family)